MRLYLCLVCGKVFDTKEELEEQLQEMRESLRKQAIALAEVLDALREIQAEVAIFSRHITRIVLPILRRYSAERSERST